MTKKIAFVVDDERIIASMLELILVNGVQCRSFVDPCDSLDAARYINLDFLLTDVMMPGMNGIECERSVVAPRLAKDSAARVAQCGLPGSEPSESRPSARSSVSTQMVKRMPMRGANATDN